MELTSFFSKNSLIEFNIRSPSLLSLFLFEIKICTLIYRFDSYQTNIITLYFSELEEYDKLVDEVTIFYFFGVIQQS
jgi:hypothetical protein